MTDPDQLERDIDKTRGSLSNDVARLNDRVSPAKFVGSRSDRIKSSAGSIKGKLMGSSDAAKQAAKDKLGSAAGSLKDATDGAAAKAGDASPSQAMREQTQGNPVAAGLIAFGVGWLVSSLVPVSQAEQNATQQLQDNAAPVLDPLKQSASEMASNLQQPAQDAADAIKQTAGHAADKTTQQAKSAAGDVQDNVKSNAPSNLTDK